MIFDGPLYREKRNEKSLGFNKKVFKETLWI